MSFKEFLEFAQPISIILSTVAVPLLVAYYGNAISSANKEAENRVKYVELATAILRSEPKPDSQPLRGWAVELLDSQAPVKLSAAAKKQLLERAIPVSGVLSGNVQLDDATASGGFSSAPPKK